MSGRGRQCTRVYGAVWPGVLLLFLPPLDQPLLCTTLLTTPTVATPGPQVEIV